MNLYIQTSSLSASAKRYLFRCFFAVLSVILSGLSGLALAAEEIEPVPAPPKAPSISEKLWEDRPLASLKASLQRTDGDLPPNLAAARMTDATWIQQSGDEGRPWVITSVAWDAPGTCHLPLYFEEPNLERMGYREGCSCFEYEDCHWTPGCLQPVWSGVHFLSCFVALPFQCCDMPPCQPISTLGVDRPGSPSCYRRHSGPCNCRGSITGLVIIVP